ncbi:EfeM/EfeO family lipoprotein [Corynebacterium imitans]|uniref:iron uptake system protein EfeO n=2 Tax=Corynebacterium TaxID=1716 RepID=UPI001EF2EAFB|nr:iron uptake system protein EfeO [Corynebacterium imitans]MCG7278885.1 EfeM/EfeO family lipoprotein [Corynebacterium imitans]MDK8307353.1 peptidase M75 family protein [Corynebacterium imitans]MDK8638553.1 peptidase M75 family protein [Corynebacterium imitans]MDK8773385.1 peptidase M75 family protein [Corynebacterium imitans]
MKRSPAIVAALALTLPLTACVENSTGDAIDVQAKEDSCAVATNSVESGTNTFSITNSGERVTEFYLLAEDGLRVIAERENITPGSTADLTVQLEPGSYFTACKPGLRGPNIGQAEFTVTGEPITYDESDEKRFNEARDNYVNFVKNEVAELLPKVEEFAAAYAAGDDDKAKDLYATTRVHYERIEPIAEALGVLDARIDYREVDYIAEADQLKDDDPTFTEWLGFHRMEKDLWPPAADTKNADGAPAREGWEPSSAQKRREIADALVADVEALNDTVQADDFAAENDITVDTVSNGAMGLLEEVATTKVTGEENWWSHKDLYDFQANIQGSRIAFDMVKGIAAERGEEGAKLVSEIEQRFDDIQSLLDEYGSLETGYVDYDEVDAGQQAKLTRAIDALREPLSKLTGTVLGLNVDTEADSEAES